MLLSIPTLEKRAHSFEMENAHLKTQNAVLLEQHGRDQEEKAGLRSEIARLEVRVTDLERRLKLNSTNSSKPPSSDFLNKPSPENNAARAKGGKLGHAPKTRKEFREPDRVVELPAPEQCEHCRTSLEGEPLLESRRHQVAEWVEKPVEVVEYRHQARCCPNCRKRVEAPYPTDIIPGSMLGPKLLAQIALFNRWGHMSLEKIQKFLLEDCDLPLSMGTLTNAVHRIKESLDGPYSLLAKHVPLASRLNIDDTGWRIAGEAYRIWTFGNERFTFLKVTKTKGAVVLQEVLGEDFQGVIISDFYAVFDRYLTQRCLAHLSRELKACLEEKDAQSRAFAFEALGMVHEAWDLWRDYQREELYFTNTRDHVAALKEEFKGYLSGLGDLSKPARLLRQRFLDYGGEIWYFLDHPEVMPHNNDAERSLRPIVTYRKMSGGSQAFWAAEATAMILSVTDTCRKQGRSPREFIIQALLARAHPSKVSAPTLI